MSDLEKHPEMPEFPDLFIRPDDSPGLFYLRWNEQLRDFKVAWDAWAADVDRRLNG